MSDPSASFLVVAELNCSWCTLQRLRGCEGNGSCNRALVPDEGCHRTL